MHVEQLFLRRRLQVDRLSPAGAGPPRVSAEGVQASPGVIGPEVEDPRLQDIAALHRAARGSAKRRSTRYGTFFISALVRNGESVEVVRLLAGHSKLDVTQRYVHAEASELRSAMSRLKVTGR